MGAWIILGLMAIMVFKFLSDEKLTNKQKSKTRRQVDIDLGVKAPKSIIFTSKKLYSRKKKHRKDEK